VYGRTYFDNYLLKLDEYLTRVNQKLEDPEDISDEGFKKLEKLSNDTYDEKKRIQGLRDEFFNLFL
jgi:hypothetical protein